jgi:hypothetical protein
MNYDSDEIHCEAWRSNARGSLISYGHTRLAFPEYFDSRRYTIQQRQGAWRILGRMANLLARTPSLCHITSRLIAKIFSYRSRHFGHAPSFRKQTPSTGEFCNKNLVNFATKKPR